jgi:protein phosphatase 1 regulatory subunit 7
MQSTTRINNPETLDKDLIEADLKAGKEVIVQFRSKPDNLILTDINALCLKSDNNFNVRFYGDAFGTFDCKILQKIPQVKSLDVDCMMRAKNIEVLAELPQLQALSLGIYELKETEILQFANFNNLTKLALETTKTKVLNLAFLSNMTQLKSLFICGHTKNIDAIGTLSHLERLRLHGVSQVPLHFINSLKQLKQLEFTLGVRENLDEIAENNIEYLSVGRVRGFNRFNNNANFKALKCLNIDEQIQLQAIDFDKSLSKLTSVRLRDCKTLSTVTGLENLTAMQHLNITKTAVNFESLIAKGLPKSLTAFSFSTTKTKEDKPINAKLATMNFRQTTWNDFDMPF